MYTHTQTLKLMLSANRHKHIHSNKGQIPRDGEYNLSRSEKTGTGKIDRKKNTCILTSFPSPLASTLPLALSLSLPLSLTHKHRQTPLSHRSRQRVVKSRRSWVAGGRQEGCCLLNKARKGACSPGKKSRCEMPRREPASYSCRDLKVSVVHHRWRREKKAEEETGRGRQKRRGEVFKAIDA